MNNKELIEKFFNEFNGTYVYGVDYILVESGDYIVICPFKVEVMVDFNSWLTHGEVTRDNSILKHCTCQHTAYFPRFLKMFKKDYETPIKCFAFKKDADVYETHKQVGHLKPNNFIYGLKDNFDLERKNSSILLEPLLDEFTYWFDIKSPNKFLFLHLSNNKVITNEFGMIYEHKHYYGCFDYIYNRAKKGEPYLPIDNKKIFDEYKKHSKTLKYNL